MEQVKQLSVTLPNRRGELARLCGCLRDAKVNIIALSVLECTESGAVRMVVDKPEKAVQALKAAGMVFFQSNVLLVPMPNRVGILAEVADRLRSAGVNVNFVYGSTGKGRGETFVVVGCSSLAKAQKALAKL